MAETILTGRYYCGSCPIGCGRIVEVKEGPFAGVRGAGPEYESIGMLGACCLVSDLEAVALAHQLCNQYGMDSISAGGIIAFAMECFEHGLITVEDTGGIALEWGDASAMVEMVRQIGEQRGLGVLLGRGTREAAQAIGGIAQEFAIHVKGLELPAHDPRAIASTSVSYATSSRGACHLQSLSYPVELTLKMPELGYPQPLDRQSSEGKGILAAKMQNLMSLVDSLKVCKFIVTGGGGVQPSHLVSWLNQVTGWDMTLDELLKAGERIFNLKRLYSVRLGISRKDDTLPARLLGLPRPDGGAAGYLPNFGQMLNEYYVFRGWDELGRPTSLKLRELDLEQEQRVRHLLSP
jgi:aldehyde:ferredoxin oxidoreductase